MRIHVAAFASAASIVTAVLYTMCALFLAAFQEDAYLFFSFLFHVDLQAGVFAMNWSVYAGGLVVWVVGVWLIVESAIRGIREFAPGRNGGRLALTSRA
jgi:hypothetical protein